jgi:hypothetical protein
VRQSGLGFEEKFFICLSQGRHLSQPGGTHVWGRREKAAGRWRTVAHVSRRYWQIVQQVRTCELTSTDPHMWRGETGLHMWKGFLVHTCEFSKPYSSLYCWCQQSYGWRRHRYRWQQLSRFACRFSGYFAEFVFCWFFCFWGQGCPRFGQSVLIGRVGFALRFYEFNKVYRNRNLCLSCVDDSSLILCVSVAYNFCQ